MTESSESSNIVIDKAGSQLSDLWKKEDYWAIWLGFLLIGIAMYLFLPAKPENMEEIFKKANAVQAAEVARATVDDSGVPVLPKTIAWHKAEDQKTALQAGKSAAGKKSKWLLSKPGGWKKNPVDAFYMSKERADKLNALGLTEKYNKAKAGVEEALAAAVIAENKAADAGFLNKELNEKAKGAIDQWRKDKSVAGKAKKKLKKPYNKAYGLLTLMVFTCLLFSIGIKVMGGSVGKFIPGYFFVFGLGVFAYVMAGQATFKSWGIGYPAWGIAAGMLIANTIGTPKWMKPALKVEYFIKTGLVLLGAEILFNKILLIGAPGIFVAWVVTPTVLITTFIFGQKVLKIESKTLNMVISADMSVCGTSAAIATAAACKAKKEELTLAIGLSLLFTSIMMIVMPIIIKATGMPYILGGAWMGGTIDATGAVTAAGAFLSDKAMYVAATIKMIQNVLIGATALGVAIYWTTKVEVQESKTQVSVMEIWHRFPKFVLGFLAASILFSLLSTSLGPDASYTLVEKGIISTTKGFRGWFFCLSFAAIGLATNFRELMHYFKGGKPVILYICGQSFNLCLTLIMAWIMFYKVFPEILDKI